MSRPYLEDTSGGKLAFLAWRARVTDFTPPEWAPEGPHIVFHPEDRGPACFRCSACGQTRETPHSWKECQAATGQNATVFLEAFLENPPKKSELAQAVGSVWGALCVAQTRIAELEARLAQWEKVSAFFTEQTDLALLLERLDNNRNTEQAFAHLRGELAAAKDAHKALFFSAESLRTRLVTARVELAASLDARKRLDELTVAEHHEKARALLRAEVAEKRLAELERLAREVVASEDYGAGSTTVSCNALAALKAFIQTETATTKEAT